MNRKPIFDSVRRLLGRGFRRDEIDALDQAIGRAIGPAEDGGGPAPDASPTVIGPAGIALIKQFEGCEKLRSDGRYEAYPDPGSSLVRTGTGSGEPWTIGWGATGLGLDGETRIGPGTIWTQGECDARLARDLMRYADDVADMVGDVPTTQNQFDALVSFHYNTGAIRRATLTRKHRAGDYAAAVQEFARWKFAGGQVLRGLVRRRAAEAKLYGTP